MSYLDNCKLMICKDCCEQQGNVRVPWGVVNTNNSSEHVCKNCGKQMAETNLIFKEVGIISRISIDWNFYRAMMDLKDKDIIEFNLKLSQFESQIKQSQIANKQQNSTTQKMEERVPKCPTCSSTNIKKIGTGERMGSVIMFGILSKKINKTFKCNNCGHTW